MFIIYNENSVRAPCFMHDAARPFVVMDSRNGHHQVLRRFETHKAAKAYYRALLCGSEHPRLPETPCIPTNATHTTEANQ